MFKHNVLTGDEIINQSDRKLIGITSQEIFHKKACDSSYFLDSDKEIYCVFYPKINTIYLFIQKKRTKRKRAGSSYVTVMLDHITIFIEHNILIFQTSPHLFFFKSLYFEGLLHQCPT